MQFFPYKLEHIIKGVNFENTSVDSQSIIIS